MRLAELLENQYDPYAVDSKVGMSADDHRLAETTVRFILGNCQPWLQASNLVTFYRGINPEKSMGHVFLRDIRQDRQPTDSPPELHSIMNAWIEMAGGVANRSNSAFVTSRHSRADMYGPVFVVMPVGDFHYTWSPRWNDWYTALGHLSNRENIRHILKSNPLGIYQSDPYDIDSYDPDKVKEAIHADRGLERAGVLGHEVMLHASKLLYIDGEFYHTIAHALHNRN